MSFKRWLTSVLCSCILLSFILVVPASAADSVNYYSSPAVSASEPSPAIEWPVNPVSATSWDTNDRSVLQGIYKFIQYLTTAPSSYSDNSVIGLLHRILNKSGSSIPNADTNFQLYRNGTGTNGLLFDIYTKIGDVLPYGYGTNALSWLSTISGNVLKVASETTLSALSDKVATESSLAKLVSTFSTRIYDIGPSYVDYGKFIYSTFGAYSDLFSPNPSRHIGFTNFLSSVGYALTYDGKNLFEGDRTLYSRIRQLQEVLASDEDLAMREDQKENVDQVKKDFITGQSGKTSLGKDDFGSLSSVGGTFKDISSLNGQASLDSFSSGLTDADTTGQGWFSQSTKDALDSVSGSTTSESTVSTFSDDGLYSEDVDPDPYNMGNFEDNYSWLWGEK